MSHLLWKAFWENDVERFRRLLGPSAQGTHSISKSPSGSNPGGFLAGASPGGSATPPRPGGKSRKASGYHSTPGKNKEASSGLGKSELNSRDHAGLTLLLRASSSTAPNAGDFVQALLDHPAIDLFAQDTESGWNALHRSLYAGNVSIARMLLEKERSVDNRTVDALGKAGHLIKTKDNEGNSPFDVYNSTIGNRILKSHPNSNESSVDSDSDGGDNESPMTPSTGDDHPFEAEGEELFLFGSNKNLSLGVGDEDDRQYPERIHLARPDHLVQRMYQAYLDNNGMHSAASLPELTDIPNLIRSRPIVIQDVVLSKLHTAILTTDPVANLYVCGVGRGGRLGLGDENTQFRFVGVHGPLEDRCVRAIALGQNHSVAVVGEGELWTWGMNTDSQLGYILPPPAKSDEEPMSLSPRQVFGTLKKETVLGAAASAIHSVAHTGAAMYCWGRNLGQLALMDADSRSLEFQQVPRRVAPSLLTVPIRMVSAIDRATTCLLANHTVVVFTNYGYTHVRLPVLDVFVNHKLTTTSFSSRYDSGRKHVRYITSGGDTIAAVTAHGDLFTMHLNHQLDSSHNATSTTNPVKNKNSVTPPQCIWDGRKNGVASVGVGEHGSVIICTDSGAVWKRVKRAKGKRAGFVGSSDMKRKDFKFERVPYITNCVAVSSSTFGAFAALRNDSKIMSKDIHIDQQSLWEDIGSMCCLNEFKASANFDADQNMWRRWRHAVNQEQPGSVPHQILLSQDLETDLKLLLDSLSSRESGADIFVSTSSCPDLCPIPAHGWLLSARSQALREALHSYKTKAHTGGSTEDSFSLEQYKDCILVKFVGIDILTLLNIVVYAYHDTVIPVWKYTREAPTQAYRFRQIRTEIMKLATKLQMPNLEAAARLQAGVDQSLDMDMAQALNHDSYFEDGDVVLEFDDEIDRVVHSDLICQRCPFFDGMFRGRSQGQWLAGRLDPLNSTERLRIDLKHIPVSVGDYVIRFIYTDYGPDQFKDIAVPDLDAFSELIYDIMSVANELMLDRLSQICQYLIGKFVTTRNIEYLLNEISSCSVTAFKDAGLEYICLQLEYLLENHLLDRLDEDLLQELDEVTRANQLCRLPFARSSRAELLLHDRYPELGAEIEEERQMRVKEMAYKFSQREDDKKLSSSYKTRFGSLDDLSSSPLHERSQQKSRTVTGERFSPVLLAQKSHGELMFDMDDDENSRLNTPQPSVPGFEQAHADFDLEAPQLPRSGSAYSTNRLEEGIRGPQSPEKSQVQTPDTQAVRALGTKARIPEGGQLATPWASAPLQTSKLDLRGIMSEATTSTLTSSLAAQKARDDSAPKPQTPTKLSQKERKRQMQQQADAQAAAQEESSNRSPWERVTSGSKPAPWKSSAVALPKPSLKNNMREEFSRTPTSADARKPSPLTAAATNFSGKPRRTASPDTRFPGQGRSVSSPVITKTASSSSASGSAQQRIPLVPHSKSYKTPMPTFEPELGASLVDIIGQQAREQELVKEAVAKRSLQEIQQEQAFQEWWDQESRRAQEDEARRLARAKVKVKEDKTGKRGGRRSRGKARAGEGKDQSEHPGNIEAVANAAGPSSRGRGRGRGR